MQGQELESAEYYVQMNRVVEALLKGQTNVTTLAKELGLPRKDVLNYIDCWKDIAKDDEGIKDLARASLTEMNVHYDLIIKEQWTIVEDNAVDLKTKGATLKQIADVVAKRQETLQRAGLYDDAGLADELAETQVKAQAIKELLRDIATEYPQTKTAILEGLNRIFSEPLVVDNSTLGLPALGA